jgi:hypothetical protein
MRLAVLCLLASSLLVAVASFGVRIVCATGLHETTPNCTNLAAPSFLFLTTYRPSKGTPGFAILCLKNQL